MKNPDFCPVFFTHWNMSLGYWFCAKDVRICATKLRICLQHILLLIYTKKAETLVIARISTANQLMHFVLNGGRKQESNLPGSAGAPNPVLKTGHPTGSDFLPCQGAHYAMLQALQQLFAVILTGTAGYATTYRCHPAGTRPGHAGAKAALARIPSGQA